jgi:Na+-driven multidrug efflux pump
MNAFGWSSFMVKVMGWWAFDVFTLLTGTLAAKETGAQTIMRNIGLFTFMIPVGLGSSMNYFVGKYIGRSRVD